MPIMPEPVTDDTGVLADYLGNLIHHSAELEPYCWELMATKQRLITGWGSRPRPQSSANEYALGRLLPNTLTDNLVDKGLLDLLAVLDANELKRHIGIVKTNVCLLLSAIVLEEQAIARLQETLRYVATMLGTWRAERQVCLSNHFQDLYPLRCISLPTNTLRGFGLPNGSVEPTDTTTDTRVDAASRTTENGDSANGTEMDASTISGS